MPTFPAPTPVPVVVDLPVGAGLHDHPKPSKYWSPESVLAVVSSRDERIAACADTGHWKARHAIRGASNERRTRGEA